jgi:hypothetical protein
MTISRANKPHGRPGTSKVEPRGSKITGISPAHAGTKVSKHRMLHESDFASATAAKKRSHKKKA